MWLNLTYIISVDGILQYVFLFYMH